MRSIINGISMICKLVVTIVEMAISFFQLLFESLSAVTSVFAYMPPYLIYGIAGVVTIAVAKTILSQGGSSS